MNFKFSIVFLSFSWLLFSSTSCKEDNLQISEDEEEEEELVEVDKGMPENYAEYAVKGGYHVPLYSGTTQSDLGYYIFFPDNYQKRSEPSPLLIFLHGSGERGNSENNRADLYLTIKHGPGKLINEGNWDRENEMLVVSAQTDASTWRSEPIKRLIEHLTTTYHVDEKRIYLTGLSMGAYGIFDYLGRYGEEANIAAAVPICGRGQPNNESYVRNLLTTPLWIFHGEADDAVPVARAHEIVSAINAHNPAVKAKMTLFPHVGHDSWTMTYDESGRGKENPDFDRFNMNVFTWLSQYERP